MDIPEVVEAVFGDENLYRLAVLIPQPEKIKPGPSTLGARRRTGPAPDERPTAGHTWSRKGLEGSRTTCHPAVQQTSGR